MARRAFLVERIDHLVTKTVMESRGVYLATDTEKAKPFADGIRKGARFDAEGGRDLGAITPAADRGLFDDLSAGTTSFAQFRPPRRPVSVPRCRRRRRTPRATTTPIAPIARRCRPPCRTGREHQRGNGPDPAHLADLKNTMSTLILAVTFIASSSASASRCGSAKTKLSRPLARLSDTLRRMAKGDLDVQVVTDVTKDEIGEIWSTTGHFLSELKEAERLRDEQAQSALRAAVEKKATMTSSPIASTARSRPWSAPSRRRSASSSRARR